MALGLRWNPRKLVWVDDGPILPFAPDGGRFPAGGFQPFEPLRAELFYDTSPYPVFDVRQHGARADGRAQDTEAVQAAIDYAPNGAVIYFPRGTYVVGDLRIERRSCLTFLGEGECSILKRLEFRPGPSGLPPDRIATFEDCRDITVTRLGFDANGIDNPGPIMDEARVPWDTARGGLGFVRCRGVRIVANHAFDTRWGDPGEYARLDEPFRDTEPGRSDRQAFHVKDSSDVWIVDNLIEDQQITAGNVTRVLIARNHILRPVFRGIRITDLGRLYFHVWHPHPEPGTQTIEISNTDVIVRDNIILEPWTHGITCLNDARFTSLNKMSRIVISGNVIHKTATDELYQGESPDRAYGSGIMVGLYKGTRLSVANVYDDITVERNHVSFTHDTMDSFGILLDPDRGSGDTVFRSVVIRDNAVAGVAGIGIQAKHLVDSAVSGNGVYGFEGGILIQGSVVGGTLLRNHVHDNRVRLRDPHGVAYMFLGSAGGNAMIDNAVLAGGSYHVSFLDNDAFRPLLTRAEERAAREREILEEKERIEHRIDLHEDIDFHD